MRRALVAILFLSISILSGLPQQPGDNLPYSVSLSVSLGGGEAFEAPLLLPVALKSCDGFFVLSAAAVLIEGPAAGSGVTFRWEGLEEMPGGKAVAGQGQTSQAEGRLRQPGEYRIRVIPAVGGVEDLARSREVLIHAYDITFQDIEMGEIDLHSEGLTESARHLLWPGKDYQLHIETSPPEFAQLVEWTLPDRSLGTGPALRLNFDQGREAEITARIDAGKLGLGSRWPTPSRDIQQSSKLVALDTEIVSQPSLSHMLSGTPVTYHARCIPEGYEDFIRWRTFGRSTPETGQGARFTTTWDLPPRGPEEDPFYWFEVRANEETIGGDFKPKPAVIWDTTHDPAPEQEPPCLRVTCSACSKCGSCGNLPQPKEGYKIYPFSGEFALVRTDLAIPARGFPWIHTRSYRSGIEFESCQGQSWDFTYNERLDLLLDGTVVHYDGTTRRDPYTPNPDGTFSSPIGFFQVLQPPGQSDPSWVIRQPDGFKHLFFDFTGSPTDGKLRMLEDRNGNRMEFIYDDAGRLIRVIDTLGRPIDYFYDHRGRLSEIRDFLNRSILYRYNSLGDLTEVTSPSVTGTPNQNDFLEGKTERYSYSSGFLDRRLNHNLLTITAPNQVASGGPPRVVNVYGSFGMNTDRVIRQTVGGTNQSGVPAGGDYDFSYENLAPRTPGANLGTAFRRTSVTDRNGNAREYLYNSDLHEIEKRVFTNRGINPADPDVFVTQCWASV